MNWKVLYIASVYVHIHNFHLPYIRGLARRGWEVDVACRDCPLEIEGANKTYPVDFEKSMYSVQNFRTALRLRKIIAERGYDLILCHTSLAAFFTRLALWGMRNRPAVCNMVHGYLFDDETPAVKRRILALAEKIMAPVTDRILTMNRFDTDYARKYKLASAVEHIDGVGLDAEKLRRETVLTRQEAREKLGLPQDAYVLLYAAEFSPRKSQQVLIDAMPALPENVLLALPGGGELWDCCVKRARELGVENKIVFPGYCRNMAQWQIAADVAVSSSRSEGLPFNILEAMHFGHPIVASDVKGHRELVENGENGLLCPYGDSAAFAEKIRWLTEHPEQAEAFGAKSAEKVKKYYLHQVLDGILDQYEQTPQK